MSNKIESIKILSGALDESPLRGGSVILRGVIAPESLHLLKLDDYQREAMPLTSLWRILDALRKGQPLPDIELGMRGQKYMERDGNFYLHDPVFIIDGQQRVNAAIHHISSNTEIMPRIGMALHFETHKEWERERFEVLNLYRNRVSSNVILRNRHENSPALEALYALTTKDRTFVLHDKVTWTQRANRGQLINAISFSKVAGRLHSHKAPTKRSSVHELVPALDKAVDAFGLQIFRDNLKTFFELVDSSWGVKNVQYRESAIQMRGLFLMTLAQFLSDHHDFWRQPDEKRLFVETDLRKKIASFPLHDPSISNLIGSAGKGADLLYVMLDKHVNSGKRTRRLNPRAARDTTMDATDTEEEAGEDEEEDHIEASSGLSQGRKADAKGKAGDRESLETR